jgi:hypothetical protein
LKPRKLAVKEDTKDCIIKEDKVSEKYLIEGSNNAFKPELETDILLEKAKVLLSNDFATNVLPIAVYRIASDDSLATDILLEKGKIWVQIGIAN